MSLIGKLQNSIDKIHAKKEPDGLQEKTKDVPVIPVPEERPAQAFVPEQPQCETPQMSVGKYYYRHNVT
jgi:hypothetical protein